MIEAPDVHNRTMQCSRRTVLLVFEVTRPPSVLFQASLGRRETGGCPPHLFGVDRYCVKRANFSRTQLRQAI